METLADRAKARKRGVKLGITVAACPIAPGSGSIEIEVSVQQSSSQPSSDQIEEARRQVGKLAEEIAQLADMELSPADFFGEFLQRIMTAVAAPAGAVWTRTQQGNLQLQYQINMRQVGIDRTEQTRAMHDELLRQTAAKAQPALVMPHSSIGPTEGNFASPGNPTELVILMAPLLNDKNLTGLVEIWQDPNRGIEAQRGFLNFLVRMTAYAAAYSRNHQLRQMVGKEQVWVQLETFVRQIHGTLNPTEAAYLIVNEGRRLLEADRVSIAIRQPKTTVVAISGADVVEKRSNLVQLMKALFDSVIEWGEKLVFTGVKDDTLPPNVYRALDEYLAESNSKLLVVQPLIDERDTKNKAKARSALLMECFEITTNQEQQSARLEVVTKHATPALYNAAEYRRIPMRFLWMPLAKLQDGLGGKSKAIITAVAVGLVAFVLAMILIPYPLKMTAIGNLRPQELTVTYSPVPATIIAFPKHLVPGSKVAKGEPIIKLFDAELGKKINDINREIQTQESIIALANNKQGSDIDSREMTFKVEEAKIVKAYKVRERQELIDRTGAIADKPGFFEVRAPIAGIILSTDFRETLENKAVRPNEPLLKIGNVNPQAPRLGDWEIELKIPQKHIGQVLKAFKPKDDKDELDVDLLLVSEPTAKYRGKLRRDRVAFQAIADRDAHEEPEPIVRAWVRVEPRDILVDGKVQKDIPEGQQLPLHLLVSGTEVHARIRCGDRPMGYSLFYGVWEFLYEKVMFFF